MIMTSDYFESNNEESAMAALNKLYEDGPINALFSWRRKEQPILTGFKIFLDFDKNRAKPIGDLVSLCGQGF